MRRSRRCSAKRELSRERPMYAAGQDRRPLPRERRGQADARLRRGAEYEGAGRLYRWLGLAAQLAGGIPAARGPHRGRSRASCARGARGCASRGAVLAAGVDPPGQGYPLVSNVRREQEAGGRGAASADRSRSKHDGKRGVVFPGADQGNGLAYPCRPLSYMPLDESGRSSASFSFLEATA